MAGIYEYLNYRITGRLEDVSRLFVYYNARVRDNDDDPHVIDDGSTVASTIETVEEFGVCPEYIWPYNIRKVNTKPNKQCYDAAVANSISEALAVDIDLNEMRACLAQGFPILLILELFKSFDKASTHGIVPMPKSTETSRASHGRHSVVLSGYSDHSRAFIVRNSWGQSWGDRGYCYIPYDYIGNSDLCDSAWTVKKLGVATMGNEGWEDEDEEDYLEDDDEEEDDDDEDDDDADIEEVEEEDYDEDDDDDE
ncbi:hypothetical protein I4U23_003664 [Adineta vaga]|nr:hypothetical protein I4U23_003664 [Adineta vaga]